ncbi:hypothetical protein CFO_g3492 [Ceratocystis platani]|uniref:Phosphatidylinositol-specific phospholipase C X domain-containing protein n=1 Tax=Ceratocystis fimbriata f. sp. platani TaxID=88771 RepID=A0A0F8DDV1_CERFI|nr:hypothetical protein CFO_g3492 [Ceratocystis platani]
MKLMRPELQSQRVPIDTQLLSGIRYFDISGRIINNDLMVYHRNAPTGYNFGQVFGSIFGFLDANPREVVILRIKKEHFGDRTSSFSQLLTNYFAPGTPLGTAAANRLYYPGRDASKIPTLALTLVLELFNLWILMLPILDLTPILPLQASIPLIPPQLPTLQLPTPLLPVQLPIPLQLSIPLPLHLPIVIAIPLMKSLLLPMRAYTLLLLPMRAYTLLLLPMGAYTLLLPLTSSAVPINLAEWLVILRLRLYFNIREGKYGWIRSENTINVDEGGIMIGFAVLQPTQTGTKTFVPGSLDITEQAEPAAPSTRGRRLEFTIEVDHLTDHQTEHPREVGPRLCKMTPEVKGTILPACLEKASTKTWRLAQWDTEAIRGTKLTTFKFVGTGATGLLGPRWEVIAVLSGLHICIMEVDQSVAGAA